jgi:uncharacterized membrane protein YqjE
MMVALALQVVGLGLMGLGFGLIVAGAWGVYRQALDDMAGLPYNW